MLKVLNRGFWLCVTALTALALLFSLLGVKLAQPEQPTTEDAFIGFYLVYYQMPPPGEGFPIEDENWVEYGSQHMDLGRYGSFSLPRKILIAQEQSDGSYLFPGMTGLAFFYRSFTDPKDGELFRILVSQLGGPGPTAGVSDTGTTYACEGTAYGGAPLGVENWEEVQDDWCWTAYRVYQMPDGTIYLDGGGNSYSGPGSFGFGEEYHAEQKINGKTVWTEGLSMHVDLVQIPRTESVLVQQFDAGHALLSQRELTAAQAIGEKRLTLSCPEGLSYTMITRILDDGSREYTLLSRDTEAVQPSATVWLLDELGLGRPFTVTLEAA